jgi:hypothetical protein
LRGFNAYWVNFTQKACCFGAASLAGLDLYGFIGLAALGMESAEKQACSFNC